MGPATMRRARRCWREVDALDGEPARDGTDRREKRALARVGRGVRPAGNSWQQAGFVRAGCGYGFSRGLAQH